MLLHREDAKPRARRLPRQIPPIAIERAYGDALDRLLGRVFALYRPLLLEIPKLIESSRGRMDSGEGKRARDIIDATRSAADRTISRGAIADLAAKFQARVSTHQRRQLGNQVRSVLGADPVFDDAKLKDVGDQFVHENVSLIVTIPRELHGDVERMVQRAISSSHPSPKLGKHIQERFGVSKRHARFIARDQISKHAGKLNRHRQKDLGIDSFVWRSVGDERVRDWHRDELDGNTYRWDKAPLSEDGEPIFPGDDYQCRCEGEPVM